MNKDNDWFFDKWVNEFEKSPGRFIAKWGSLAFIASLLFYVLLIIAAGIVLAAVL